MEPGSRFGSLVILEQIESEKIIDKKRNRINSRKRYRCVCDCGNIVTTTGTRLRRSVTKQCASCSYKLRPQSLLHDPLKRLFNLSINNRSKKTNIPLSITIEEWSNINKENCFYCGALPDEKKYVSNTLVLKANGIDRLDSSVGYSLENSVACCKDCNTMKNSMSVDNFLLHIQKIIDYTTNSIEFQNKFKT